MLVDTNLNSQHEEKMKMQRLMIAGGLAVVRRGPGEDLMELLNRILV